MIFEPVKPGSSSKACKQGKESLMEVLHVVNRCSVLIYVKLTNLKHLAGIRGNP